MEISDHSCFSTIIKKLREMSVDMGRGRYHTPAANYPFLAKLRDAGCIPEIHVVSKQGASVTVSTHVESRGNSLDGETLEFFI